MLFTAGFIEIICLIMKILSQMISDGLSTVSFSDLVNDIFRHARNGKP